MNNGNSQHPPILTSRMHLGPLLGLFRSPDGKHWTRVNDTPIQKPLEELIAQVQSEFSLHCPNAFLKIVDTKTGNVLYTQEPMVPTCALADQFVKVSAEDALRRRDDWMTRVFKWLLPESIFDDCYSEDENRKRRAQRYMRKKKIEIMTKEDGSVRILREGDVLAEWTT